ncbi:unnamed protein product [Parnassius apollo]|uniref:(apollo) hypothetical protein n=1 Tax=Parnassius apollo TaxID=110799 RepID=A0A8S3W2D3_PARAO|nr:unnamed protein product [Parnassius apollo]
MNTSRSKMLVRLSKQNIKHYNNTDLVTVVSNVINDCLEKENRNRNNHNEYENYLQDDLGSRNFISPIIPLSESQLNECISEELGERVYAQLVPALICDKNLDDSNISTEDFHQSTSSHIHVNSVQSNLYCDLTSKTKIQSIKNQEHIATGSINNLDEDDFDTLNLLTGTQNIISTELSTEMQPAPCLAHSSPPSVSPKPSTSLAPVSPIAHIETQLLTRKKKRSFLEESTAIDKPAVEDNCQTPKKPKRNRDPAAILETQRLKHPLLPPCSCKKQCIQKISETERQPFLDTILELGPATGPRLYIKKC